MPSVAWTRPSGTRHRDGCLEDWSAVRFEEELDMLPTTVEMLELSIGRDAVIRRALEIRDRARTGIIPTHGPGAVRPPLEPVEVEWDLVPCGR